MSVRLLLALLIFYYQPDADKIFSVFAGTQFLLEGLTSACALFRINEEVAFYLAIVAVILGG